MVSSLLVESLSSPTDVLLAFYDSYDHDAINDFPMAVAKHFSDIFRKKDAFLEVRPNVCLHLQANSQVSNIDTSPHPLALPLISRSRSCPVPRLGPRYFTVTRNLLVQIAKWEMRRLGLVRFFPTRG